MLEAHTNHTLKSSNFKSFPALPSSQSMENSVKRAVVMVSFSQKPLCDAGSFQIIIFSGYRLLFEVSIVFFDKISNCGLTNSQIRRKKGREGRKEGKEGRKEGKQAGKHTQHKFLGYQVLLVNIYTQNNPWHSATRKFFKMTNYFGISMKDNSWTCVKAAL